MFRTLIALAITVSVGCTQHNPAVCCNTPTQCTSFGLDGIIGCDTGKVCDSTGACISPQCATSSECAEPSPYCSGAGLCEMSCVADTECPGGGQTADQIHCVGGACVECGQASDCPTNAPICAASMCHACTLDAECPSQACASDGTCVGENSIAYVDPAGPDGADCSRATPCSLVHGLSIGRPYTVLASGTYTNSQGLVVTGTRWILGGGTQAPAITRSTPGPIISVGLASDLHFSNLQINGATNTSSAMLDGDGIECRNPGKLELADVVVTENAANGVDSISCTVMARRSTFTFNGGIGLYVVNQPATIDRCQFSNNVGDGLDYDGTVVAVTNSFFTSNQGNGVTVSTGDAGGSIQFCTAADNFHAGINVQQQPSTTNFDLSNNLIARNLTMGIQCVNSNCPSVGSIVLGSDASTAHFKSFTDYHITAGSIAIDAASGSTNDHDFDGDVRPMGNGRDVGADEVQ